MTQPIVKATIPLDERGRFTLPREVRKIIGKQKELELRLFANQNDDKPVQWMIQLQQLPNE